MKKEKKDEWTLSDEEILGFIDEADEELIESMDESKDNKEDGWTISDEEILGFIDEAEEYSDVASRQKKKRRIVVNVTDWMWRALKHESRRIDSSINAIIRMAIHNYFREKESK